MEFIENTDRLELQRCWSLLRSRWKAVVLSTLSGIGLSALLLSQQQSTYEASGRLLIRSEQTAALTGLDVHLGELRSLGAYQKDPLDTQLQILRSAPVIAPVIHQLNTQRQDNAPLWTDIKLLQQLNTEVIRGTDVLQVSFQSEEPAIALTVINLLIQSYIEHNIATNRQEVVSARLFIEQQLPESEAAVRRAEADLSQFKNQHRIVTLDEESSKAIAIIADLDQQQEEAQTQLADVEARFQRLRQQIGLDAAEALETSILSESPAIQDTLAQRQEIESELVLEQVQYQPGTPVLNRLENQVQNLNLLLQRRVDEILESSVNLPLSRLQVGPTKQELISTFLQLGLEAEGLKRRIQSLSQITERYKNRALLLPSLEQEQRELNRRLSAAQTTYENLLAKLEEINAAENQTVENARVIEAPTSAQAISNLGRNGIMLMAGGVVGALCGISGVFLLAALQKPVRTIQRAKELLNYDVLGVIPAFDRQGHLRNDFYRAQSIRLCGREICNSAVQGSYRTVVQHVLSQAIARQTKTLLLTSATPGEGKSEVGVNLAMGLAQLGHKVLLIDANPQAPTLQNIWPQVDSAGLTSLLLHQGDFQQAIQSVFPHLHVLSSGPDSVDTSLLLRSKAMENLMEYGARHYDYVLLDGPSLAETDYAYSLGEVCTGILFVLRPSETDSDAVMAARQGLQHLQRNILGMVINGVDIRVEPSVQLNPIHAHQNGNYQLVRP